MKIIDLVKKKDLSIVKVIYLYYVLFKFEHWSKYFNKINMITILMMANHLMCFFHVL